MNPEQMNELKQTLKSVVSSFEDKEKFLVAPLAVRLTKAFEENKDDQTLFSLASYLAKVAQNKNFISRKDLKEAYSKLYTSNTKCANYLEKELKLTDEGLVKAKIAEHDPNEGKSFSDIASKYTDAHLVSALESSISKDKFKPYSSDVETKAAKACLRELNKFAFKPRSVKSLIGDSSAILCEAYYETPKGLTSVLVPVEFSNSKVLTPTVFVGESSFYDLKEASVKDYILHTAGKKISADFSEILKVIKTAKFGLSNSVDEIEQIVLKAKASSGSPAELDMNGILLQTVDKEVAPVDFEAEDKDLFAQRLASAPGQAEFLFGKEALNRSKSIISKMASDAGLQNSKVTIADFTDKNINFVVAASGQAGFKVPVKVTNKKIEYPTIALASGKIESFDVEGIRSLIHENDYELAVAVSDYLSKKSSDLVELMSKVAMNREWEKASDILNVLNSRKENVAYAKAFEIYRTAMSLSKTASKNKENCCSKIVKSASSVYPVCGHTNLPTHMVYQDEHGNCCPKYRKNIDNSNDGGSFMHSSVYLKY